MNKDQISSIKAVTTQNYLKELPKWGRNDMTSKVWQNGTTTSLYIFLVYGWIFYWSYQIIETAIM